LVERAVLLVCAIARMLACVYPRENFEVKTVAVKLHPGKSKRKSKSVAVKEKLTSDTTEAECSNGEQVSNEVRFYSVHSVVSLFALPMELALHMYVELVNIVCPLFWQCALLEYTRNVH